MANSPKMSLKLLVDMKAQKVLFAEVTKEFVDFLFHIFSLPLSTLIELIGSKQIGCLGKLKECIDKFNDIYLQPDITKDDIFNPKTPYNYEYKFLLSNEASTANQSGASKAIYKCPNNSVGCLKCINSCRSYASVYENSKCPACTRYMTAHMSPVVPKGKEMEGGYVNKVVTYMVMDDLVVKPMSSLSTVSFLKSIGVEDLSQVDEKMVIFENAEALKLLKASLITDKVLTTVFL